MNIDKSYNNSSCEPAATERRSKKLTDITDAHGVFDHGFFLTFPFDANRFQTDLQALPLAAAENEIIQYFVLIKASAHALAKSVLNLHCPARYNQNQNKNQKQNQNENQKTNP